MRVLSIAPNIEALDALKAPDAPPFALDQIRFRTTSRGCLLELPMAGNEEIYGFGLQLKSHRQTGKKKTLRVNSDPVSDTGDSHAPVPFYVSTAGYGVFVDTARYASFYSAYHDKLADLPNQPAPVKNEVGTSTEELYGSAKPSPARSMAVEVPTAKGVDVYIFAGPALLDAVRRYVLFSGGGALPPLWGLGIWYRVYCKFNQEQVLALARSFRDTNIPCDVIGLEPGWQTQAYSCSYLWNKENFPDADAMIQQLAELGYNMNLWEHGFVHPTSPIHSELKPHSGDIAIWKGLAPDFSVAEARQIFADYHDETFVQKGITGFKLDECDSSDFIGHPWSFPDYSQFPGGMDGEQMHSLFGLLYQETLLSPFRKNNVRTLSQVRSSHALAAKLPFVLYSDLYAHDDFIRGVVSSGFSGLLWSPEVRQCLSVEELIRRLQSVILSPQALINSWMIPNPPWWQFDEEKNRQNLPTENWESIASITRKLFELRMSLLPYLYSAFAVYHFEGTPPFRALVMDFPDDPETYNIDDEYLIGESLLFAPIVCGQTERKVYLPRGAWHDFHSGEAYEGGQWHTFVADLDRILLFVKENTLLPLAAPLLCVKPDTTFDLTVRVFGPAPKPIRLFVDDGVSFDYEKEKFGWLKLSWSPGAAGGGEAVAEGNLPRELYKIKSWATKAGLPI